LLPLGAMAVGCAEERDPINQVQANALHKSFFVGDNLLDTSDDPEFYSGVTVVDVPYGADQGFVFPGLVGGLTRIKWEITEQTLNARLTYELHDGIDGHGSRRTNDGRILASFPITTHFDIRRGYNLSTGEELNVVVENTSDRPWYEREYFRVDWSSNLVTSSWTWDPLADGYSSYSAEPLAYYVNEPGHPDAPVFATDQGYFDVTNKIHLKPSTIDIGNGPLPACVYRGSIVVGANYPWGTCENSEITVRYSYRRVPQEGEAGFTDYEPIIWDGARMRAFGAFVVDRLGWDRNYGLVDQKWRRFAQRYNIWEKSHLSAECATPASYDAGCDPTRDDGNEACNAALGITGYGQNGTHDECDPTKQWGSRCDELAGKCTIPYAKREIATIPWHFTVNTDDVVIFDSSEQATWQWDTAMRIAVQTARRTECEKTSTASLVGTRWGSHHDEAVEIQPGVVKKPDTDKATDPAGAAAAAKIVCKNVFPIDEAHDDAEAIKVRNVNQCTRDGGGEPARAGCIKKFGYAEDSVAAMEPLVQLCHNPVAPSDHPACGPVGLVARPGDIRYHQVNAWPTRQSSSPWGYGPSLGDPLTGEIISAGINIYNAVTDYAAQGFMDTIRWMNGEISYRDITSGEYVHDWVRAGNYAQQQGGPLMNRAEADRRVSGITGVGKDGVGSIRDEKLMKSIATDAKVFVDQLNREVLPPGTIPEDNSIFEERIARAKKGSTEAKLMNPMWLQMGGVDPNWPAEAKLEFGSPLRQLDPMAIERGYQAMQKHLADRGQCILHAPEPTGLPALAKIVKAKFPYDENASAGDQKERLLKIWDYLRAKLNYNVILHEMGHTVSLRHNFVSSYDKINYKPQYWQLRTKGGTVTKICKGDEPPLGGPEGSGEPGENCIGPRYFDPLTTEEADQSIWTWQQTSVMDYAGDITQDMLGLGVYDYAAARMFYADVVDVWDDGRGGTKFVENTVEGDALIDLVDNPGYLFPPWLRYDADGDGTQEWPHYSAYNKVFDLVKPERCEQLTPEQVEQRFKPAEWDESRLGKWDPIFDGNVVRNEVCARPARDYVQWNDMVPDTLTIELDPIFTTPRRARDQTGRPRMPYGFLSDEYADGWSPSSYRHDNGADMYEEIVFHSNLYENRHIFDNFRNGRATFTVYGAFQRALSRYHYKVSNLGQGFAYSVHFIFREFARNQGYRFSDVIDAFAGGPGTWLYDHAVAAAVAFDHFVRVLTRPHVGQHYRFGGSDRLIRPAEDIIGGIPKGGLLATYMPNGNLLAGESLSYGGRPLPNDFQYGQGYWTFDYLNQAGSYYEKTFAVQQILEASNPWAINFFRYDGLDARFRHINYSDLFPDGVRRLVGIALTEDYSMLGPRMSSDSTGIPATVTHPDDNVPYPKDPLAWLSYVPQAGPVACAPVNGILSCVDSMGTPFDKANGAPPEAEAWVIDPQVGYEVQKFIVFWTYVYQPRGEELDWIDMLRLYRTGSDIDPEYLPDQRIEWKDPESGLRYIAKRYGTETLFGKPWDKGVASKMIQWANELTEKAYELDPTEPKDPVTGRPNVVFVNGKPKVKKDPGLPAEDPDDIQCSENRSCVQLRNYRGLLDFTRQTAAELGFPEPELQLIAGSDQP
jgi:hypothetical protein